MSTVPNVDPAQLRQRLQAHFILHGWEPLSKGQLRAPSGRVLFCGPKYCGWDSHGDTIAQPGKDWSEVYLERLVRMYTFVTGERA